MVRRVIELFGLIGILMVISGQSDAKERDVYKQADISKQLNSIMTKTRDLTKFKMVKGEISF